MVFLFPTGRKGFGPGEQEYGYVDVRPKAHMFYWLYHTTAEKDCSKRPLVMWLPGSPFPGVSATSEGNFLEAGPLTVDLKERNSTWVGCPTCAERPSNILDSKRYVACKR